MFAGHQRARRFSFVCCCFPFERSMEPLQLSPLSSITIRASTPRQTTC